MREIRFNGFYIGSGMVGFLVLFLLLRVLQASMATEPEPLPSDVGFAQLGSERAAGPEPQPQMDSRWGPPVRRKRVADGKRPIEIEPVSAPAASPPARIKATVPAPAESTDPAPSVPEPPASQPPAAPPVVAAEPVDGPEPTRGSEHDNTPVPEERPPVDAGRATNGPAQLPRDGSEEFAPHSEAAW